MKTNDPERNLYLQAWLIFTGGEIQAYFLAAGTPQRTPAVRVFKDEAEARRWVATEADFVRAPVEWVEPPGSRKT